MSVARKQANGRRGGLARRKVNRAFQDDLRVEAYGTLDELNSAPGFARSLCTNAQVCAAVRDSQGTVFRVASAFAVAPYGHKAVRQLSAEDVDRLPEMAHAIRAQGGILPDWTLPGAHIEASALEMARAVCRGAKRCLARSPESGEEIDVHALPYISRLSDMIRLFARQVELDARMESGLPREKKADVQ